METVLDANVLVRGTSVPGDTHVTVPEVVEEVESRKGRRNLETVEVEVREPGSSSVEEVLSVEKDIGADVSEADRKLAALALERGSTLVTDDFDLLNLCEWLEVSTMPYMSEGIEEKRRWVKRCESCGAEVEGDRCGKCGSSSVRRQVWSS